MLSFSVLADAMPLRGSQSRKGICRQPRLEHCAIQLHQESVCIDIKATSDYCERIINHTFLVGV